MKIYFSIMCVLNLVLAVLQSGLAIEAVGQGKWVEALMSAVMAVLNYLVFRHCGLMLDKAYEK